MLHTITLDPIGFVGVISLGMSIGILIPFTAQFVECKKRIAKYNKIARESRERVAAMQKEGE